MPQEIDWSKLPDSNQIDLSGLPDQEEPKKDLSQAGKSPVPEGKGLISQGWDWLNRGLVSPEIIKGVSSLITPKWSNVFPSLRGAEETVRDISADISSGMTSPLNLGMMAATGGAYGAARAGAMGVAKGLDSATKLASIPVAISGASKLGNKESSLGERALGGLEMLGGGLGVKYGSGVNLSPKIPKATGNVVPEVLPSDYPVPSPIRETALGTGLTDELGRIQNIPEPLGLPARGETSIPNEFSFPGMIEERPAFTGARQVIEPVRKTPYPWQNPSVIPRNILAQPEGGAIVNPPTEGLGLPAFNPRTLVGEEARSFRTNQQPNQMWPKVVDEMRPVEQPKKTSFDLAIEKAIDSGDDIVELHGGLGAIPPKLFRGEKGRFISEIEAKTDPNTPLGKLLTALRTARPLRKEQEAIYSSERSKRLAQAMKFSGQGEASLPKQLGALKGPMEKVKFESVRSALNQNEIDSLSKTIDASKHLSGFEKINAKIGLGKLLGAFGGNVPTNSELRLLKAVFGREFAEQITELHGGLGLVENLKMTAQDALTFNKSIMASADVSAPFRQGLGLVHTKEFWKNIFPMFKAFGSKEYYDEMMDGIEKMQTAPLMRRARLALTDQLTSREEAYASKWASKYYPGVRQSDRAYSLFLNKTRADVFERLLKDANKIGIDIGDDNFLRKLGEYVNVATGRATLPKVGEAASELLNIGLFSPRLQMSRMKMLGRAINPETYVRGLNPFNYTTADAFTRRQYLKSIFSQAAFGTGIVTLAGMAGADVNLDPTNADFGKMRIGNTRIDPWAGHQQYLVLAARLRAGAVTSSKTGKTYRLNTGKFGSSDKWETGERFVESKFNPLVGFLKAWMSGKDFTGQPTDVQKEVARLFVPMILEDMWDLANDDPDLLPLLVPGMGGVGIQTYSEDERNEIVIDIMRSLGLEPFGGKRDLFGNRR